MKKEKAWKIIREDIASKMISEKKKEIEQIKKSIKRIKKWVETGFWSLEYRIKIK